MMENNKFKDTDQLLSKKLEKSNLIASVTECGSVESLLTKLHHNEVPSSSRLENWVHTNKFSKFSKKKIDVSRERERFMKTNKPKNIMKTNVSRKVSSQTTMATRDFFILVFAIEKTRPRIQLVNES
jgi:hypothetical protein